MPVLHRREALLHLRSAQLAGAVDQCVPYLQLRYLPFEGAAPPQSACTRNVAGGLGASLALRSKRSSPRKKSSAGLGKPQAAVLPRTGRGRDDEASRTGQTVTGKVFMGVDGQSRELWRDGSCVSNITTSHLPVCPPELARFAHGNPVDQYPSNHGLSSYASAP